MPFTILINETIVFDSIEWKEYINTFTAPADMEGSVWIGLLVAQSDIDFWIDDFRFFEGLPKDEIRDIETMVRPIGKLPISWGKLKLNP